MQLQLSKLGNSLQAEKVTKHTSVLWRIKQEKLNWHRVSPNWVQVPPGVYSDFLWVHQPERIFYPTCVSVIV